MAIESAMHSEFTGPSLLIFGGTDTGKSHYGAQLLRRLQVRQGDLRMVGTPPDLSAFQEVIDQLALGRSAGHTPSNVYRESTWHVRSESTGVESRLLWPDYAGEQVEDILKLRHVSEDWVQRIRSSDGWLLCVRPSAVLQVDNVLLRPRAAERMRELTTDNIPTPSELAQGPLDETASSSTYPLTLSHQAGFVELLQSLLFVIQADVNRRARRPALVIALTCWDEVTGEGIGDTPSLMLRRQMPLLSQFIESNWDASVSAVMGISALGKPLQSKVSDDDFVEGGPERNGWCVLEDGTKSPDLTLPLAVLMQKSRQ